jgi:hypothetical protein
VGVGVGVAVGVGVGVGVGVAVGVGVGVGVGVAVGVGVGVGVALSDALRDCAIAGDITLIARTAMMTAQLRIGGLNLRCIAEPRTRGYYRCVADVALRERRFGTEEQRDGVTEKDLNQTKTMVRRAVPTRL